MIRNINNVFACFIIVICLVFAYFTAFTDFKSDQLYGTPRRIFVAMMLAYAAFRTYRLIKALKEQSQENEE
jgi:hypothetical protein